ncbi:MAG: DUF1289 domain-containing protein [Legionellales bacterium]|jgi:hypothetical protein
MVIDTPCVGVCSSVYGDLICRGCKRTAMEVIEWNRYDSEKKVIIYQRLHMQISQIFDRYIDILDEQLIHEKIIKLNIRLHSSATPTEKAFHLLRLGASKIKHLPHYGMQVKPEFLNVPLVNLFNQIDAQVYELASTSL